MGKHFKHFRSAISPFNLAARLVLAAAFHLKGLMMAQLGLCCLTFKRLQLPRVRLLLRALLRQ
jgi:hypothetical protein